MAKKAKKKKKQAKQGDMAIKIILAMGIMTGLIFLPSTFFLSVAMLPTLIAAICFNSTKAITIGAMNLAGSAPFLIDLWSKGHNFDAAINITTDPRTIIVAYCAAGIGYLIDWAVTGIVATMMVQRGGGRMKAIKARHEELIKRWGPEVSGEIPLDNYGFPLEEPKAPAKNAPSKKADK